MSYELVQSILQDNEILLTAAEVHGMAVAIICVDERTNYEFWFQEIFTETANMNDEQLQPLIDLFNQTQTLLTQEQFEFDLFLPEEDCLLHKRAEATAEWCRGFIDGIGYFGAGSQWPGQCNEILGDIIKFSNMSIDEDENEDMENALMEIDEYLRVAIQLIHTEILEQKNHQIH